MMKNVLIISFVSTFIFNSLYSQDHSFIYYSKPVVDSFTNSDIKVLDKIESSLVNYSLNPNTIKYADIFFPMTNEEFKYVNLNTPKTSKYESYILWNSIFELGYLMSFSRLYEDTSARAANREYVRFITPLYDYRKFLDSINYNNFQKLITDQLKSKYSIIVSDSINISMAMLSIDSTDILTQAPIKQFSELLYKATAEGELAVFGSPSIKDNLTRGDWSSITSGIIKTTMGDQTVSMVKIHNPIKLIIVTKWELLPVDSLMQIGYLQPALQLKRKISSIGLEFPNQKRVFYNYDDIKLFCRTSNLNYEAFNQSFISYSLKNLEIQY